MLCSAILTRFCKFCAYSRPRYQVSVYRTIGPLISSSGDCVVTSENVSSYGFFIINKTTFYIKTYHILLIKNQQNTNNKENIKQISINRVLKRFSLLIHILKLKQNIRKQILFPCIPFCAYI